MKLVFPGPKNARWFKLGAVSAIISLAVVFLVFIFTSTAEGMKSWEVIYMLPAWIFLLALFAVLFVPVLIIFEFSALLGYLNLRLGFKIAVTGAVLATVALVWYASWAEGYFPPIVYGTAYFFMIGGCALILGLVAEALSSLARRIKKDKLS